MAEEFITFVNDFGRETVVASTEVDHIARLHKLGLRVKSSGESVFRVKVKETPKQEYTKPTFQFYSPYDNILTKVFHDTSDIQDAEEFWIVLQDLEGFEEMTEQEAIRIWAYYKRREEWKDGNYN